MARKHLAWVWAGVGAVALVGYAYYQQKKGQAVVSTAAGVTTGPTLAQANPQLLVTPGVTPATNVPVYDL